MLIKWLFNIVEVTKVLTTNSKCCKRASLSMSMLHCFIFIIKSIQQRHGSEWEIAFSYRSTWNRGSPRCDVMTLAWGMLNTHWILSVHWPRKQFFLILSELMVCQEVPICENVDLFNSLKFYDMLLRLMLRTKCLEMIQQYLMFFPILADKAFLIGSELT